MGIAETYAGRNVFVTGHTGFKGSWISQWLVTLGAHVTGYALDPPDAAQPVRCPGPPLADGPRRRRRPGPQPPRRGDRCRAAVGDLPPRRRGDRPPGLRPAGRDLRDQRHGRREPAGGGAGLPVGAGGRDDHQRQVLPEPGHGPGLPGDGSHGRARSVQREQGVRGARDLRLPGQLLRRWRRGGFRPGRQRHRWRRLGAGSAAPGHGAGGRRGRGGHGPQPGRHAALAVRAGAAVGLPPPGIAAAGGRRPALRGSLELRADGHGRRSPRALGRGPVPRGLGRGHLEHADECGPAAARGQPPEPGQQQGARAARMGAGLGCGRRPCAGPRSGTASTTGPLRGRVELVEDHLHAYQADARAMGLPWAASEEPTT